MAGLNRARNVWQGQHRSREATHSQPHFSPELTLKAHRKLRLLMQLKNSTAGPGSCTQVWNHSQQASETQGKWKGGRQNPIFQNCK